MKIAIIGAGNVGQALGRGWSRHEIIYGVRDPDDPRHDGLKKEAEVLSSEVAAAKGELVVLATPWPETADIVTALAEPLAGKTLVDATNPLQEDLGGLTVGHNISGAEFVQTWAPHSSVVKAFNTTGFNIMQAPEVEGRKAVMFIAGDDPERRHMVAMLAEELGFEALEVGHLETARLLEPLALLWISLAYKSGLGREFAFGILRRAAEAPTDGPSVGEG